MIPKKQLLLLAGLVWFAAGFNVLRIGVQCYPPYCSILNALISFAVYLLFQWFVFSPLVKKHTRRISQYTKPKQAFWRFFDKKSFLIMACMMTFGIGLRASGLAPAQFIAVFYTGLGAALTMAGILFMIQFGRFVPQPDSSNFTQ